MISLILLHGGDENIVNGVASNIDVICEETGCRMEWGDPTEDYLRWNFFFRNQSQEESVLSMLKDLENDYPYCVAVN